MGFLRKLFASKKAKTAVMLTVTIIYFGGLIAFFINPSLGTILWAAALIPSIMIYIYEKQTEREEALKKAQEEAAKNESDE